MERLDKFLCDSGVGTRSQVKVILKSGRVTVDGKPEKDPGKKIDPRNGSQRNCQPVVRQLFHFPNCRLCDPAFDLIE